MHLDVSLLLIRGAHCYVLLGVELVNLRELGVVFVVLNVDCGTRKDEEATALDSAEKWQNQILEDALSLLKSVAGRKLPSLELIELVLNLRQLHQFILNIFECFHFISDKVAVAVWEHPEEDSLEVEALGPFLADWRRQFSFQILQLV